MKWNSHGFTCVPHPDPLSHLPLHPLPLGFPSAPGPAKKLLQYYKSGFIFILPVLTSYEMSEQDLIVFRWNLVTGIDL